MTMFKLFKLRYLLEDIEALRSQNPELVSQLERSLGMEHYPLKPLPPPEVKEEASQEAGEDDLDELDQD